MLLAGLFGYPRGFSSGGKASACSPVSVAARVHLLLKKGEEMSWAGWVWGKGLLG